MKEVTGSQLLQYEWVTVQTGKDAKLKVEKYGEKPL
jgi:hypothetical protein